MCDILHSNIITEERLMKIAVVCGGISSERDVSVTSGTNVARALRERGHKAVLVDLFYGYSGEYSDPAELFEREQEDLYYCVKEQVPDVAKMFAEGDGSRIGKNVIEICKAADICFLALHGEDGEDGKIQATLDMHGIKYTGSGFLGSAIAMNKEVSKIMFRANGIPTPAGIIVDKNDSVYENVGFPCVVKPCSGGSSVGTSLVKSEDEYNAALELAFKYEDRVVVEKYIKGREFSVTVMDGKAFPPIEIVTKNGWFDYKDKYQSGYVEELCPAPITDAECAELSRISESVADALKLDVYFRADFIMDEADGKFYCLEANTIPGMTPTSFVPLAAGVLGMDFGDVCEKILALSMEKYK